MFEVPLSGPTKICMDNGAVYQNSLILESTLKKDYLSWAFHRYREAVAAGTVIISREGTETNLADLFTKLLPAPMREILLNMFTY